MKKMILALIFVSSLSGPAVQTVHSDQWEDDPGAPCLRPTGTCEFPPPYYSMKSSPGGT